ncbi:hypothetical protein [Komagataeibacter oboediens]|uniref:hypothetical protein n=1 Tax=Komagataeibacter oboediens TaxID=65958 RepID=UPI001C2D29BE|nr:hypothetical protein [Komagataeibacter oboediens]MBV1825552.1 hypothetical protein [Komagataeibacter oboediens]
MTKTRTLEEMDKDLQGIEEKINKIIKLKPEVDSIRNKLDIMMKDKISSICFHFDDEDVLAKLILSSILTEDKKKVDLKAGKCIYYHRAHVPGTQDHLHFYQKGSKLFALNRDGTAHDKNHGVQIPNWAQQGIKTHYPDFTIPLDGLIESLAGSKEKNLLLENKDENNVLVPPDVISRAEEIIKST